MANRDSAFLWETEALRSAGTSASSRGARSVGEDLLRAGDWLTLREASEVTGVPTTTIRKWARHDNIPSFLEKTPDGHLRVVSLAGIREWASQIGREIHDNEPEAEPQPHQDEIDLTSPDNLGGPTADQPIPEGSMLVPLDAWNKVLNQLGNLHEAGQQLAEARERAAKAETEALFLKERLSEMRTELEKTREAIVSLGAVSDSETDLERTDESRNPAPSPATLSGTAAGVARRLYQGWRQRRAKRP